MMAGLCYSLVFLLLSIYKSGWSYEFKDDFYYDYYNEVAVDQEPHDSTATPSFLTSSLDSTVNEGETIRLPCQVENLHGFVLMWKKDGKIITLGESVINNKNGRYLLESHPKGNSLVIRLVSPADNGEYTCQVSSLKPIFIKHRVLVRVKPIIQIE